MTDYQVILVVEDEVMIRMLIADVLREEGYGVIEAACGDEGMEILASGQDVDLVITDVRMPGVIDGIELAAHAKQLSPERPVVMVSAHLPYMQATDANIFIAKPFVPSMLLKSVYKLIGSPCQRPSYRVNAS